MKLTKEESTTVEIYKSLSILSIKAYYEGRLESTTVEIYKSLSILSIYGDWKLSHGRNL